MTDNATPKARPNYSRPTKYPAALSFMTTEAQRAEVDRRVDTRGEGVAEVARGLLGDGADLDRAYNDDPGLREDVARLARDGGVEVADALRRMLRFAVTESERRLRRNALLAVDVAKSFAEIGLEVDGVEVGDTAVNLDGRPF